MLEDCFSDARVIDGYRGGPFGPWVDGLARGLRSEGYARSTVRLCIQVVGRFGRWIQQQKLQVEEVSAEVIGRFLGRSARTEGVLRHERTSLAHLLEHLRQVGVAVEVRHEPEADPIESVIEGFSRYLLRDRALAEATLCGYCPRVRLFLSHCFGTGAPTLDTLTVKQLHEFALHHARGRAPRSTQLMLTALRSFLRYLFLRELIGVDLSHQLPKVASWPRAQPPKWLPPEDIQKVLNSCNRHSLAGQRDHAILLLLARLGLRAGEIVSLELENIRWETAEIDVCGKRSQRKRFPLPEDVGEAIAAYLKEARPRCSSRRVFLRAKAPYRGLGHASTVDTIVSRALKRAGLDPPLKGAHLFRHSLATRMLRNGATLTEIGQILHHANPDTTSIYAKVDISGLRALAMPWPGEHS